MHWLLHPHWAASMDFRISAKLVLKQKHMHTLTKRNEEWASVKSWKRLKWIMLVHQRRLNRSYVDRDEAAMQTVCCLSVSVWKAGRPWRGATNRERSEGVRNIWLNRSEDATQLSVHLFYAVCLWPATALSFDAREHYHTTTLWLHHYITLKYSIICVSSGYFLPTRHSPQFTMRCLWWRCLLWLVEAISCVACVQANGLSVQTSQVLHFALHYFCPTEQNKL